jgi:hypothetical protein
MMLPLFVSYLGVCPDGRHHGWLVFTNLAPIESGDDVSQLCRLVEKERGWPEGTVVINSFQRLEAPAS